MKPFLLLIAVGSSSVAWARPVAPVKKVRTVFDAGARGDAGFNSHLREQMRAMGFRFIPSRSKADAILRSNGQGTRAGGFRGFASLTAPHGKAIWSAEVERAPHSRAMAFESLAQKLRAAQR